MESIIEYFKLIFSENLLDIIIKIPKIKRLMISWRLIVKGMMITWRQWMDGVTTEMLAFLRILILTSRFRELRKIVRDLWFTRNNLLMFSFICQATISSFLTFCVIFVFMIYLQDPKERNTVSLIGYVSSLTILIGFHIFTLN